MPRSTRPESPSAPSAPPAAPDQAQATRDRKTTLAAASAWTREALSALQRATHDDAEILAAARAALFDAHVAVAALLTPTSEE